MATTHVQPAAFLTTPGEIRNAIYRILLTETYAWHQKSLTCSPLYPAILQANRQIYEEAVNILHGENIWITAEIDARYWPRFAAIVPNVSRKDPGNIKHPALHIKFATPVPSEAPQQHVTFIMGGEILEYFVQVLWRLSTEHGMKGAFKASSLELTLCETPFHTKSKLQSTYLRPFGLVCGLQNLVIRGRVEPARVEELLHSAASLSKDVAQIQDVSQYYLDKGDKAYFAGEWFSAIAQYSCGADFLWHMAFGEKRILYQDFTTADKFLVMKAIWVTASRSVRVFMAFGDYKSARKVGHSVYLMPDLRKILRIATMTQNELLRARFLLFQAQVPLKVYLARVNRALGEKEYGFPLLEEAFKSDSDKTTFLAALAELFPNAGPEQNQFLVEQQAKLQSGDAIEWDVIRAFWETV